MWGTKFRECDKKERLKTRTLRAFLRLELWTDTTLPNHMTKYLYDFLLNLSLFIAYKSSILNWILNGYRAIDI